MFDSPVGIMKLENIKHGIITLSTKIKLGNHTYTIAEQKCVIMNLNTCKMINGKMISPMINQN